MATAATSGGHAAASKAVMRAGRHYAQFTVVGSRELWGISLGVIGPNYAYYGLGSQAPGYGRRFIDDAAGYHGNCFYDMSSGQCRPRACEGVSSGGGGIPADMTDWEGMQGAEHGDRIGLLLDLEAGTLTVFKNDTRLGVMATDLKAGWEGYCWAVSLNPGDSVCIESALMPATAVGSGDSDGWA